MVHGHENTEGWENVVLEGFRKVSQTREFSKKGDWLYRGELERKIWNATARC